MEAKEKLIVALDIKEKDKAFEMVDILANDVEIFKVGIAPFVEYGDEILAKIKEAGKKVFLDLKFHDIPNTVKRAAYAATKKDVFMMNFHCVGGKEMLRAAREGAEEAAKEFDKPKPILLGVTVLTSMDENGLNEIGISATPEEQVIKYASMAKEEGLDGVVASARETKQIKETQGDEFVVVTPGIRPEWAAKGDQKRIVTPADAIKNGSDYIVVGRPILEAANPPEAAQKILEEM